MGGSRDLDFLTDAENEFTATRTLSLKEGLLWGECAKKLLTARLLHDGVPEGLHGLCMFL